MYQPVINHSVAFNSIDDYTTHSMNLLLTEEKK